VVSSRKPGLARNSRPIFKTLYCLRQIIKALMCLKYARDREILVSREVSFRKQGWSREKSRSLAGEGQTEETHSAKGEMSDWRGAHSACFLDCGPWRVIDSRR
jgi:hypothetical protein